VLKSKNVMWRRIAGTCGILAPILAFTFICLAVASYPQFSWMGNALSDLGVVPGVTAALFNYGLIISGMLFFIFSTGMFLFLGEKFVSRTGAFVFALACLALVAIGVFPENVKPTHYLVSVAFFVLLPISLLIITGAFWLMSQVRMAVFTLLVAIAAAAPWILYFSIHYVSGVAVPEAVSGLAGSVWAVVLGFKMLRDASRAKTA
jgi:hypothetical membrane protein